MESEQVAAFILERVGGSLLVASEAGGAPEVAWGDMFFYATDDHAPPAMPFATIVHHDYPGFDEASHLNRPGVYRLNFDVGRDGFEAIFPDWNPDGFDFTVADRVIPHPVYWRQGWLSIVSPTEERLRHVLPLLVLARERAAARRSRGA